MRLPIPIVCREDSRYTQDTRRNDMTVSKSKGKSNQAVTEDYTDDLDMCGEDLFGIGAYKKEDVTAHSDEDEDEDEEWIGDWV